MQIAFVDDCVTAADVLMRARRSAAARRAMYRAPAPKPKAKPRTIPMLRVYALPIGAPQNPALKPPIRPIELPNFLGAKWERHTPASRPNYPSIRMIIAIAAAHYDMTLAEILSERRDLNVLRPRQMAMYLAKKLTPRSLPDIGRQFGRDHTTIINAVQKISALIEVDVQIAAAALAIEARIAEARA